MEYSDIIKENLERAREKRDRAKNIQEKNYWQYIINMLISDYREYTARQRWESSFIDVEEILKRFFNDFM